MRILIADDSAVARMVLERIVQNMNLDCEILLAHDGEEARNIAFGEVAPAVMLLDWMMPKMDGIDLCRAIRESEVVLQPYIFLVSAKDSKRDIAEGLNAGANDYLIKPYNEIELNARLRVGLRMYNLQRELTDRIEELESARREISLLQKLLPVCMYCKKVSPDDSEWRDIETYVEERTDVSLSHVMCPDCRALHHPEL